MNQGAQGVEMLQELIKAQKDQGDNKELKIQPFSNSKQQFKEKLAYYD